MTKRLLLGLVFISLFLLSLDAVSALCSGTYPSGYCVDEGTGTHPQCQSGAIGQYDPAYCNYNNGNVADGVTKCTWVSTGTTSCNIRWSSATCSRYPGCRFITSTYYLDADGDKYGSGSSITTSSPPPNYYAASRLISTSGDCVDTNKNINPGRAESCYNGVDDDCDGFYDAADSECKTGDFYYCSDSDRDGYIGGLPDEICVPGCTNKPAHCTTLPSDCVDTDSAVHPGATEICGNGKDDDCNPRTSDACTLPCGGDSRVGQSTTCGLGVCRSWGSYICSSSNSVVNSCTPGPSSSEVCHDGLDNDCDGQTDENCGPAPSAEVCDGVDNDLNGLVDDGVTNTYYLDNDGDKYGSSSTSSREECSPPTSKWHLASYFVGGGLANDCNDANINVNPSRPDLCDRVDNDCNPGTPDGIDETNYGSPTYCGQGECYNTGQLVCQNGNMVSDCSVLLPDVEICDSLDNDCDGQTDEGCSEVFYYCDGDSDGYISATGSAGSVESTMTACGGSPCIPPGCSIARGLDCNDADRNIRPGVTDICGNGIDESCSGADAVCPPTVCTPSTEVCNGVDDDCDGNIDEGSVCGSTCTPSTEVCNGVDDDCDGNIDEGGVCVTCTPSTEICNNGVDDDCDGFYDAADSDCKTGDFYYCSDSDGDGYIGGLPDDICVPGCTNAPAHCTTLPSDCVDTDGAVHPGATEVCDSVDNDCDGNIDEGGVCTPVIYYCDADADGYDKSTRTGTCVGTGCQPSGCSTIPGSDCNDGNSAVRPGATEICDAYDNDCDGGVNEGGVCTPVTYYRDSDGDGYVSSSAAGTCIGLGCQPSGTFTSPGGDCNDADGAVHPGATEICDAIDNDCDGGTNEGGVCIPYDYYCDSDSDGYIGQDIDGGCIGTGCEPASCQVTLGSDCNDANPAISPGDTEICNWIDDDCDGQTDEGNIGDWYFRDIDGDGYSDGTTQNFCFDPGGSWYRSFALTSTSGDCNDNNPNQYPGNGEICDGLDNDCNSVIDDPVVVDPQAPLADKQAGVCLGAYRECGGTSGWVEPNYLAYNGNYEAGAEVSCDYLDNDCDGPVDEVVGDWYYGDVDRDGWLDANNDIYECVYPSPDHFLVSDSFQPQTDGLWDQDDNDPVVTYNSCNGFDTFIVQKNNLLGDYGTAVANDWAFDNVAKPPTSYTDDKYRGACTSTSNWCVAGSSLYGTDGITAARGTKVDGTAYGFDGEMYCSNTHCDAYGCAWLDLDSDSATCAEGLEFWTVPGDNVPGLGEFEGLQSECCGDDANEQTVARACKASTSITPICCPDDGTDWYNLDGECVASCPDLMNSVDTFIALPAGSEVYQGYAAVLSSNPNGYCCDGSANGAAAGGASCKVGESGCFISEGIPGTQDATQARKFYCQAALGDQYCMVETCLEGHSYEVCEAFNYCNEVSRPLSYGNSDRKVKCEDYITSSTPLENSNYFVTSGCTAAELTGCEAVTREICTGTGDCDAVCQVDDLGNTFGCQEVCTNYNCQTVTSYHGAECALTPSSACVISTQSETLDSIDSSGVSNCAPLGVCNQFGCAASACDEYGCPASAQYFQKDTVCEENFYCTDLGCAGGVNNLNEPDMRCFLETVDNGNPLLLNISEGAGAVLTNSYFQCNPVDTLEEGDPWCEYSASSDPIAYQTTSNRCESAIPFVCDTSPVSGGVIQAGTRNGCDVINATGSDYWNLYNGACVIDGGLPSNVYEAACCFAYSIDSFDVYDNALTNGQVENGIRIY